MKVEELARLYSLIKEAEEDHDIFDDTDDIELFGGLGDIEEIEEILDYADALEKTAALYKMAAQGKFTAALTSVLKKYWPHLAIGGGGAAGITALVKALKKRKKSK